LHPLRFSFSDPWIGCSFILASENIKHSLQVSSLLGSLLQLVKTGFTKAVQRLDGIYALLIVGKIAAADIKAGVY